MKQPFATRCRARSLGLAIGLLPFFSGTAPGQVIANDDLTERIRAAAEASDLGPLAEVPLPEVPNLAQFLSPGAQARTAALILGKALFWDMQAGSDGQACASCHFHAGADNRSRNQLSPGLRAVPEDTTYGGLGYPLFGPDYDMGPGEFPLHLLEDTEQNNFGQRVVLRDTNDVVSSMGVFAERFVRVVPGRPNDVGAPFADPVFNFYGKNVRRVEPRNTPTVINAVFNHSNFWDGRAHNLFNGVSVIGPLDTNARIWVNSGLPGATPGTRRVRIPNSSLASQAVGPPTSDLEMSFFDRPFPMVGRKLLRVIPLGLQRVHPSDSVLGRLSLDRFGRNGIAAPYAALIALAFQPKYWNGGIVTIGTERFTHMEANFALFWGLAIQLYESTLVSDITPFDAFMLGEDALSEEQLQGLLVFLNLGTRGNLPEVDRAIRKFQRTNPGVIIGAGNCVSCHGGPEFTDAAFTSLTEAPDVLELIELEDTAQLLDGFLALSTAEQGLLDNGFSNIGVRPDNDDMGRGGMEGGFPLAFTRQALAGHDFLLQGVGAELPCTAGVDCPATVQVDGAFKVPGLRNVLLTGPYFHNGGQATLSQVIEFYDRQSDFGDVNIANLDRNMVFIDLDEVDEEPLVEFLLALTDERVRQEQAPFDHPQLFVPNGGTIGNEQPRIELPAVGAGGRPAEGLPPLGPFLGLPPD